MPRREDERQLNLSKKHPEACTCRDCTDRFLKKKSIKSNRLQKRKPREAESVKRHAADCQCPSCSLLSSVDFSSMSDRGKAGLLKRLFGKR